ncbi:hypothetical protein HZS_3131 [Henneguya salminicola]|nr:hypothetical protein HZS_3131 [Henneguya salminicola]
MTVSKRDYKIAVSSLWFLSLVFITLAFVGFFLRTTEIYEYGTIVDISSYDIEFNLYRWSNKGRKGLTGKIEKMYTVSCDINVHQGTLDSTELSESMFRCMRQVTSFVENFELKSSTVFIYGTELTRIMCEKQQDKCNEIFTVISGVVSSFDLKINEKNMRALEGFQEAIFGWISVNDYFNKLETKKNPSDRFGGLDLKNYSLLLSFEGQKKLTNELVNKSSSTFTLYGNEYSLSGVDMMCYGVRQAYKNTLLQLIKYNPKSSTVKHPCHANKHTSGLVFDELFTPCVGKPTGSFHATYNVKGNWDAKACDALIKQTLSTIDKTQELNINIVKAEFEYNSPETKYFGFSRIAELASIIDFKQDNFKQFIDAATKICDDTKSTPEYSSFCFDALYANSLIVDFLGIDPTKITVGNKEKIETVTGSMVNNSDAVPCRKCARIIANHGMGFMMFTVIVFTGLGGFILFKLLRTTNDEKYV